MGHAVTATYQAMAAYTNAASRHQNPAAKASRKIAKGYRGMVMNFLGARAALDVAAALAAKKGSTPLEVPLTEIHQLLREHGAIIPGIT